MRGMLIIASAMLILCKHCTLCNFPMPLHGLHLGTCKTAELWTSDTLDQGLPSRSHAVETPL